MLHKIKQRLWNVQDASRSAITDKPVNNVLLIINPNEKDITTIEQSVQHSNKYRGYTNISTFKSI